MDYQGFQAAIKASICTGEKVAGFIQPETKKFIDIMLIRNDRDIDKFCKKYKVKKESIKNIW